MAQLSAWMGASMVAAGVSAALIVGADTASADTGSDTTGASASATGGTADTDTADPSGSADATDAADAETDAEDADADVDADVEAGVGDEDADDVDETDTGETDADGAEEHEVAETSGPSKGNGPDAELPGTGSDDAAETGEDASSDGSVADVPPADGDTEPSKAPATADAPQPAGAVDAPAVGAPASPLGGAQTSVVGQRVSATLDAPGTLAAPAPRSLQEVFQSLMMEIIGAAVRFVSGPPVVPRDSNVTVRSSRLEITEGRTIRADWYYPDGAEPPQRLIYLQHGYLGIGPMYSYTAAWLAERTNSIVVAPTLSSNRYVKDGFWLGDDQVYRATADLLLGDRDALTASAVAAGFARKYGADATLPESFTLVGHSLGAGVAAGAAGYYADAVTAGGATNRLAGIILLDGAPPGNVLPEALDKLDGLGGYIPVLELGAPRDGETRRVDAALNAHRPGHFNGVVLDNGEHLDSMQGGSWLIQFVSYLYQGFPTEQNKSAAQTLIAGWINDIFAGRIDPSTGRCETGECAGIYADPGAPVSVSTPKGPATGVVIGTAAAPTRVEFRPLSVTSLVSRRATAVSLSTTG